MRTASDMILGGSLAVFGGLMLRESYSIGPPVFETFGAAPVPRAAALVVIVLGLVIVAGAAVAARRSPGPAGFVLDGSAWRRTGSILGIFVVHSIAVGPLGIGFVMATVPALAAMFLFLGGTSRRFVGISVALALTLPIVLFLVFTRIFQIDLP